MSISRRDLLRVCGAGAAATAVLALTPGAKEMGAAGIGTATARAKTTGTARLSGALALAGPAQETFFDVRPAISTNNLFAGITLPQHPYMAENNWSNTHQDAYCSESWGLAGPTSGHLRLLMAPHPFGMVGSMVCTSANQMMGVPSDGQYIRLVVFDQELNILASPIVSPCIPGSWGGAYYYLNHEENTVLSNANVIRCYPTSEEVGDTLDPLWTSANIVELVTGSADGNVLYTVLPVWDDPELYWCLLSGAYDPSSRILHSEAYIAVVQIVPDGGQSGCTATLVDAMRLPGQWNNNSFAVDEEGAYFVTNGVDDQGISRLGKLIATGLDPRRGKIELRWAYDYRNSGIPKVGKANIGSGTTPTLMNLDDGTRLVAIMDNALPQENVVVVDRKNGRLVAEVPLFPRMRGGNEASLIGVKNWVCAENNFGHSNPEVGMPQLVPNEPGLAMIRLEAPELKPNVVWEDTRTVSLGMNMLCRESGVIFAHTADWYDSESATQGAMYYISAIDAWDGRVIWRIPLGRGRPFCKDYGGQYFDRDGNLYIGADGHLVSIRNA